MDPDLPFTIQTRTNDRTRSKKKYNPYGDDFVVDRIDLKKIGEEPLITKTLSHTIHRQKTGVYLRTWKKGII